MACATITINSPAKALDLMTLLTKGGAGYTVAPTGVMNDTNQGARCSYLSVQASPINGTSTYVYKGDSNVRSDGTCQGKELTPGTIDVQHSVYNSVHLGEIFLNASAAGLKANIEVHWS